MSIRDNIAYGCARMLSARQLEAAARASNADGFIRLLPEVSSSSPALPSPPALLLLPLHQAPPRGTPLTPPRTRPRTLT
jgi:hypothetical protein